MYEVHLSQRADKFLGKLDEQISKRENNEKIILVAKIDKRPRVYHR